MSFEAGAIEFRLQVKGADEAARAFAQWEQGAQKAGTAAQDAAGKTDQASKSTDQNAEANKRAKKAVDDEADAQRKATAEKGKASPAIARVAKELGGMSDEARRASTEVGGVATAIGAGLVGAVALNTKAAIDWESAWAGVTKTVDGSASEMAGLQDELRQMATELPASHEEIAAVAEAAGQLGVAREDISEFTKVMIDLGETTNLSSDQAATSLAQFMNIMGTAGSDVDKLGATIVALGNDGASTEAEIVMMAQRIAGAGALVGATEGEVLGLANALASMGVTAELGGGVASRVLQDLYSVVATGGSRLQQFADVAGMSADEFATAFGDDPVRALGTFAAGLNGVEASGGNVVAVLGDLGFKSTEEQRVLLQLKSAGDLLTESLDLQGEAWAANTALQEEAEKRYETTAAQLGVMRNRINEAAIDLGSVFLPAVSSATDVVGGLADTVAGLPEPVQGMISTLGLGAGTLALVGGSALMAVPKILEIRSSIATLRKEMPETTSRAGALAKGLGLLAGLGAAVVVLDAVSKSITGYEANLKTAGETTQAVVARDFDAAFSGLSSDVKDLDSALELLLGGSLNSNMERFGSTLNNAVFGGGLADQVNETKTQFEGVGQALADMVNSGDPQLAAARFNDLAKAAEAQGFSTEQVMELLPAYQEALDAVGAEQALMGEQTQYANEKLQASGGILDENTNALARWQVQTEEDTKAYLAWIEMVTGASASFVDLGGALDNAAGRAQAMKDGTLEAWEETQAGVQVSVQAYLDELARMVEAQTNWETNMILLTGRVSDAVIDELAALGPEGAPLVAELVNASDEELARFEELAASRSAGATQNFATGLDVGRPIIEAAAAQLGEGAAREIAQKLEAGTSTVEQIVKDYGLVVEGMEPEVKVNTGAAAEELRRLEMQLNTLTRERRIQIAIDAGVAPGAAKAAYEANGGVMEFYANGGMREHHVAQIASAGTMRVWAEPETGGEAYIPLASSKRGRSTAILETVADRFGYGLVPRGGAQSFADGGLTVAAQMPSLSGLTIQGTLDLGNGLTGMIRGTVMQELNQLNDDLRGGLA